MRASVLTVVIGLAGCGRKPAGEAAVGPPASMIAPRASSTDEIVATVNGKPVWGSCVAIQGARGATKQAALQQCLDFEILAQAADQRGYASSPEVREATHTAMVSELVASAYEEGFTRPAQFGSVWQQALAQGQWKISHENYRASSYVRVPVAEQATQAEVEAAKATADQIATALAHETGLLGPSLLELAQAAAPGVKIDHQDVTAFRAGALDKTYAAALFSLREIGRASAAVRTKWGWDVVVWTDDVPETHPSDAEIEAKLLPDVKLAYFDHWVDSIAKSLGVHAVLVQKNIAKLEDLP
ncbi:hypothetical protein BH11MYX1_BH11MYX1_32770 [soil metagenome]